MTRIERLEEALNSKTMYLDANYDTMCEADIKSEQSNINQLQEALKQGLQPLDTIGTGYTEATILEFITDTKDKFIGYIPSKKEYIIATVFADNSYGWSTYGTSIQNVLESYKNKNTDYSMEFYKERLDSALSEGVDALEYWNDDEECIELVELAEQMRGIINA